MTAPERLPAADPVIKPTRHIVADLEQAGAEADVTAWWEEITGAGGEGMVAKPLSQGQFQPRGMARFPSLGRQCSASGRIRRQRAFPSGTVSPGQTTGNGRRW
jgi:hypothetical protein